MNGRKGRTFVFWWVFIERYKRHTIERYDLCGEGCCLGRILAAPTEVFSASPSPLMGGSLMVAWCGGNNAGCVELLPFLSKVRCMQRCPCTRPSDVTTFAKIVSKNGGSRLGNFRERWGETRGNGAFGAFYLSRKFALRAKVVRFSKMI